MTCKCDAQLTRTLRARRVRVACALRARVGAAQPLSKRAEALKPAAKRQKKSHESVRSAVTAAKKNGKTTSGKGSGKARAKKPTSGKGSGKGRGKGSDKGTTAEAPPEKEEEEIPPIGAKIFTVGDDMYVADETKTFSEPEVGNRIIYFVSAPARPRSAASTPRSCRLSSKVTNLCGSSSTSTASAANSSTWSRAPIKSAGAS